VTAEHKEEKSMSIALRLVEGDVSDDVRTVDGDQLRRVFRQVPASPAVVTTSHHSRPVGLTVTSLRSLSLEPALLSFSLTRTVSTWPALAAARQVLVHLLDARHLQLAERFATSGVDRFAAPVRHTTDPHGLPRLEGPATVLRAEIVARHRSGDADLFVAAVVQVHSAGAAGHPIVYHDGDYRHLLDRHQEPGELT
jgi:flavin reductase (DIM6/NTAB) family NADH-FMN oxidoreductase RutF